MITTLLLILQWLIVRGTYTGWEPRIALPGECGKKEYYNECGSSCRMDCYSYQIATPCTSYSCEPGCYCLGGLYRYAKEGVCVKREKCKKFHNIEEDEVSEKDLAKILNEVLSACNASLVANITLCEKHRSDIIRKNKWQIVELLWELIKWLRSSEGIPLEEKEGIPTEGKYVLAEQNQTATTNNSLL